MRDYFNRNAVAVVNREGSSLVLNEDKSIVLTSDISMHNEEQETPTITIRYEDSMVTTVAETVIIDSFNSKLNDGETYGVVYGERLMEMLKWIITVLKTHSHGPNSPAIPDFHDKANEWMRNIEKDYLLNRNVRTR